MLRFNMKVGRKMNIQQLKRENKLKSVRNKHQRKGWGAKCGVCLLLLETKLLLKLAQLSYKAMIRLDRFLKHFLSLHIDSRKRFFIWDFSVFIKYAITTLAALDFPVSQWT